MTVKLEIKNGEVDRTSLMDARHANMRFALHDIRTPFTALVGFIELARIMQIQPRDLTESGGLTIYDRMLPYSKAIQSIHAVFDSPLEEGGQTVSSKLVENSRHIDVKDRIIMDLLNTRLQFIMDTDPQSYKDIWIVMAKHGKTEMDSLRDRLTRSTTFFEGIVLEMDSYLPGLQEILSKIPQDENEELSRYRLQALLAVNNLHTRLFEANAIMNREKPANFIATDLRGLVGAEVERMLPVAVQAQMEIVLHGDETNSQVIQTDPLLLQIIIFNLINNGLKYGNCSNSRRVDVTLQDRAESAAGDCVVVMVRDYGIGMDEETLGKVRSFQEGYRSESAREHADGQGLGLFLTHQLAEKIGARLEIESAGLGEGSEFSIILPLVSV
jgi:signal transduction histidine kinase